MATAGAATMAERNRGGRPKSASPARNIMTLRGSEEWRAWIHGLADHVHMPTTVMVDQALIQFAKSVGYAAEPPQRTGG